MAGPAKTTRSSRRRSSGLEVPPSNDQALVRFLTAVKEHIQSFEGFGNPAERFVTVKDLVDVGLASQVTRQGFSELTGVGAGSAAASSSSSNSSGISTFSELSDTELSAASQGWMVRFSGSSWEAFNFNLEQRTINAAWTFKAATTFENTVSVSKGKTLFVYDTASAASIGISQGTNVTTITGVSSDEINFTGYAALKQDGTIKLQEVASPEADEAGYSQIWVLDLQAGIPYFTADDGTASPLSRSASPFFANQDDTVDEGYIDAVWYGDDGSNYELTLQEDSLETFPIGCSFDVWNESTGTLTITEGTDTTLFYMDGSAITDVAGSMTLAEGGYLRITRKASDTYIARGQGGTP